MFWRKKHPVSPADLAAYADGHVMAGVEAHIPGCDSCQRELAELRAVQAMLSALPAVEPRRSFALTPAMAGEAERKARPMPRRQPYSLGYLPALAMTVLVLLFAVDLAFVDTSSPERATFLGNGAADLRTMESADSAGSAAPEAAPSRGGTPSAAGAQAEEPATMPAAAADRPSADDAGSGERQAAAETRSDTTARDALRVLQLIAGLALIVSLFVWLRARLRV